MADVCLLTPPSLDPQSFALWVSGFSAQTAGEHRCKIDLGDAYNEQDQSAKETTLRLYIQETVDCFRTYAMLEKSLRSPRLLSRDALMLSDKQQRQLLGKYYSFESTVMRAFLGRKLTNKFRKDLDDVEQQCDIPLRSVRRQFDNLRRIFDRYDDVGDSVVLTTVQEFLEMEFLLPRHLSRSYACAIFLLAHRFQLQISKKKYQLLTWEDCCYVAEQIMLHWLHKPGLLALTELGPGTPGGAARDGGGVGALEASPAGLPRLVRALSTPDSLGEDGGRARRTNRRRGPLDLGDRFLADLRDLKPLVLSGIPQYIDLVVKSAPFQGSIPPRRANRFAHRHFRSFLKSLVQIATGLSQAKEFRDFFEDLLDDVCVPLKTCEFRAAETGVLFSCLIAAMPMLPQAQGSRLIKSWTLYLKVMSAAACRVIY